MVHAVCYHKTEKCLCVLRRSADPQATGGCLGYEVLVIWVASLIPHSTGNVQLMLDILDELGKIKNGTEIAKLH